MTIDIALALNDDMENFYVNVLSEAYLVLQRTPVLMMKILKDKIDKNHIAAISLSLILLLSALQFGSGGQMTYAENDKDTRDDKRHTKFDLGFYEKLKKMQAEEFVKQKTQGKSYKAKEYLVTILVDEPEELDENPDNFATTDHIKNKLESVLIKDHKASMTYKGLFLSFVNAILPITEITKLADYYYVDLIADGYIELKPSSLRDGEFSLVRNQIDKALPIEANLDSARSTVNAVNLPLCPDGSACDGSGIKVAVVDFGIWQNHPDLPVGSKIVLQRYCNNGVCSTSGDLEGEVFHGTANAGIIASTGNSNPDYRGIAPGAQIVNVRTTNTGTSAALDWAGNNAKVINISLETGVHCNTQYGSFTVYERLIDEAAEKGKVVVAAVGNNGSTAIGHYACAFNGIAVGAMDDRGNDLNDDDIIWAGSNYGPLWDGRSKPDLLAPGVLIKTASRCLRDGYYYSDQNYYRVSDGACLPNAISPFTGTSHASPFVAATAALLFEKNPGWTPAQIKAAIKQAAAASLPNFEQINTPLQANKRGAGVLDVAGALAITNPDVGTWGYAIDFSTYTAKDPTNTPYPITEYKLMKETDPSFSGGISAINGKFRNQHKSTSPQYEIFEKLAVPVIKINGALMTLGDSNLYAGPRVDLKPDQAYTYVTYWVDGKKLKLIFKMKATEAFVQVVFYGTSTSKTYEVLQYYDYDVIDADDDRARLTASGSAIQNEIKYTNKKFYLRDLTGQFPYLEYTPQSNPTEWILKLHPMTDDPDQFLDGEPIGLGQNLVVDTKISKAGNGSTLYVNPKVLIKWPLAVTVAGADEITIIKDAIQDDPQDFSFTGDLGSFTLDDDDSLESPSPAMNSITAGPGPGTWSVTEIVPPGWIVTDIYCVVTGTTTFTTTYDTVTVTLTGDGGAECTFENVFFG
jgi:serine protease AprX